ncbi:DUF4258 domain-containing protein [Candidatus Sumerlaeota bacterium]|nr:DUF4258 domain-containing protein [Candidatus Sumerlaeota bacterium]
MKIKLSRHAKRRCELYNIDESKILKILESNKFNKEAGEILENVEGLKYPLKIVFSEENDLITVITAYPLKKGKQR